MPRSIPTPLSNRSRPSYFTSLDTFRAYSISARTRNRNTSLLIPYQAGNEDSKRSKLVVCHDFKGGYGEKQHERGYTFSWWEFTDSFIYFSHHRVSPPPHDWIRAAHRHGTKIFGTLIFEGDEGRRDILRLILGDGPPPTQGNPFANFNTDYADLLVDLAVERGFEGWLVNVEVALGIEVGDQLLWGEQHAVALVGWLAYLTSETRRRIPGGETIWYDGVNFSGEVRWQNALTDLNLPFFNACDSIFLNYFWQPSFPSVTAYLVDTLHPARPRNEVAFGVDVWGRNQYGGGGFESWRAVECITGDAPRAPQSTTASSQGKLDLSIALFAPGWTMEFFEHDVTTREGYAKWWGDERYLWAGGAKTSNVEKESTRMLGVRKGERGAERARMLARALSPGWTAHPIGRFDYEAPLPVLPGSFKSLVALCDTPRPPPPGPATSFFTNFSNGSGHRFFLNGTEVMDLAKGWTDVDFTFPSPSLLYRSPPSGVNCTAIMTDEEGWSGSGALKITISPIESEPSSAMVDLLLCPLSLLVRPDSLFILKIMYKFSTPPSTTGLLPQIIVGGSNLLVEDVLDTPLASGWTTLSSTISSHTTSSVTNLGLSFPRPPAGSTTSFLIGSISIIPKSLTSTSHPKPRVTNLILEPDFGVRWTLSRSSPVLGKNQTQAIEASSWGTILFYTIWHAKETLDGAAGSERRFLGTTAGTEFEMQTAGMKKGKLSCCPVGLDGEMDWEGADSIQI